ncbi:regulator of drug sensitivity 1 [Fusarium mexicanum]|uniref:Regulator of drug sensitivity 1 n=1 Tax=Fusarium mexicanum TaxID=751941 RepID=A0A8H5JP48_9HYPO|nr:regulator of drug sensitivity 1 [Fusarium mexicanum]
MLRTLTSVYFNRVSTLRCLDFLHKPSFNHSLDKGSLIEDYGEAILYAICAHGHRIRDLECRADPDVPGRLWAEESQAMVMREIGKPTLMTAMTLVLLCDFALQTGQDALAFMLCGCCHSIARLLALDRPVPSSNNGESPPDNILIESRRRVLWSCFILDSIVGSGVDENLRWRDGAPQISLPRSDQSFLSQVSNDETPLFLPRGILRMMAQHLNPLFSEYTTYAATYEATKILIVYTATLGEQEPDSQRQLKEDIMFNMKVLREQTSGTLPSRACRALTRLFHRFGFNDIANSSRVTPLSRTEDNAGEVSGPPEAFYLSDLAPFRRAYDDVNKDRDRRESAAGSLASSTRNLTQEAPVLSTWNQQLVQPLGASEMPGNQVSTLGDYTQVAGDMSNEITWDLFSLPDWVFEQYEMDFGA